MRTTIVATGAALLLAFPAAAGHAAILDAERAPEGCEAMNPAAPQCSFTVQESMDGPVAGAAGIGTWVVKVKRGKKTVAVMKGTGAPTAVEFLYEEGDKVSVVAVSPGSSVIAGGD